MTDKSEKLEKLAELADSLGKDPPEQQTLMKGLTDQQMTILRFKMRGLSQKATANLLKLTPARVSQEMRVVREHYIEKGSDIDQAAVVGESLTLYEEVEIEAWEEVHGKEGSHKLRALGVVMDARERQIKLLMDTGMLRRAATQHEHKTMISPLMEALLESPEKREAVVATIVQVSEGIEPEPPEDEDYDESIKELEAEAGADS